MPSGKFLSLSKNALQASVVTIKTGGHGQSGLRHFAESGAFSAEERLVVSGSLVEEVDPLIRFWFSYFRGFFSYSAHGGCKLSHFF